jgi:hypothetical protein
VSNIPRHPPDIPVGLKPYFQEYDLSNLDLDQDADLIIQRSLEFGTWEEVRWMIGHYGMPRVRVFLKWNGERWLSPVVFNYWRKLLDIEEWRHSPFQIPKGELWNP